MFVTPRRTYGWGRAIRLRKHAQFCRVQSKGRRLGGKFILVIFAPSSFAGVRHGLTVSKRVGNAVTRNRIKRRLRDILRHHNSLCHGFDLVWIAKSNTSQANYAELRMDVEPLLQRILRSLPCPPQ